MAEPALTARCGTPNPGSVRRTPGATVLAVPRADPLPGPVVEVAQGRGSPRRSDLPR